MGNSVLDFALCAKIKRLKLLQQLKDQRLIKGFILSWVLQQYSELNARNTYRYFDISNCGSLNEAYFSSQ